MPLENSGGNMILPLRRHGVCNTDGLVANGDAADLLLLAIADINMGTLYSIFGLHPYAAFQFICPHEGR